VTRHVVDDRVWPDSAGSQLSAIAEAEAVALTRDLAIASEEDGRLNLQQETNSREPAAPCTRSLPGSATGRNRLSPCGNAVRAT
jgi:hypothetical protein